MGKNRNKQHLRAMSAERQAQSPIPNFGISEKAFFQMQKEVTELRTSNNSLVQEMNRLKSEKIDDRASEAHVMCQMILDLLVRKNMTTKEEVTALLKQTQYDQYGLAPKESGVAEKGDTIIMSFQLFNEAGEVVDDRSKEMLAYEIGSNMLPCEEAIIGIHKGETRMFDVKFDSPNFKLKELIGKPLKMSLSCLDVKMTRAKEEPRKEITREALLAAQSGQSSGAEARP